METISSNLTEHLEGFLQEKVDLSKYEPSFRRWLVAEIELGRISWQEARARFGLPYHFDKLYRRRQLKYTECLI
jgi:hypothetical protein